MEHTPTPWMHLDGRWIIPVSQQDRKIGGSTNKSEDRENYAAEICFMRDNETRFKKGEVRANAEFIVRACNSHDQLVAALKDAKILLELNGVDLKDAADYGNGEHAYQTVRRIHEALSAAGEQS